jgi:hypothetical protein
MSAEGRGASSAAEAAWAFGGETVLIGRSVSSSALGPSAADTTPDAMATVKEAALGAASTAADRVWNDPLVAGLAELWVGLASVAAATSWAAVVADGGFVAGAAEAN